MVGIDLPFAASEMVAQGAGESRLGAITPTAVAAGRYSYQIVGQSVGRQGDERPVRAIGDAQVFLHRSDLQLLRGKRSQP